MPSSVREPAEGAVKLLVERDETVGTAESLTGGLVADAFVVVPGSSAAFRGGVVAYATELKNLLLGVPAHLLAERGAVDPDVAVAMANGVRERVGSDWGVATTGVAGPDPQDGKAPGLVYVAVSGPSGTRVEELHLEGGRADIRQSSTLEALNLLLHELEHSTEPRR